MSPICISWLLLATGPVAQTAEQKPKPDVIAAAQRDLRALSKRYRGVAVLTARYVQRRTTELTPNQPLVSEGTLAFRRKPGCAMFRVEAPRASVIRLDEQSYQVYRPKHRRVEKLKLPSPELPRALFTALAPDDEKLERAFEVRSRTVAGRRCSIGLRPKESATRDYVDSLVLTFAVEDHTLMVVAYTQPGGDLVELELRDLDTDPKQEPSFELELPRGTKVVERKAESTKKRK